MPHSKHKPWLLSGHTLHLFIHGKHCPCIFLEYPLIHTEHIFGVRHVKQKLPHVLVALLEQTSVTLFRIEPVGQDVHTDKLVGKHVKHCEDWVQVKHVDWFKKAFL